MSLKDCPYTENKTQSHFSDRMWWVMLGNMLGDVGITLPLNSNLSLAPWDVGSFVTTLRPAVSTWLSRLLQENFPGTDKLLCFSLLLETTICSPGWTTHLLINSLSINPCFRILVCCIRYFYFIIKIFPISFLFWRWNLTTWVETQKPYK